MNSIFGGFVTITLLVAVSWSTSLLAGSGSKMVTIANIGLATPESVEYYAAEDVYLVTNLNGSPFVADGNGFISKIRPDGTVANLKWIDGTRPGVTLHSPKGAAIHRNKLYVADLNQVHIFELPSGKQRASITIKGSTFLNGITAGAGNYIYVTDSGYTEGFTPSGTDAIYKVRPNGKYKAIIKGKDLGHPNGIIANGYRLRTVTFGSGAVVKIDPSGRKQTIPAPNGGLDGLLEMKDGSYVMSSWGGSAIYVMNKQNKFRTLADSLDAPADLGFDTKRNLLLVPLFKQNKVVLLPM
jgi:hypothetical protein